MKTLKNIAVAFASIVIFTNITYAQTLNASYSVNHSVEPLAVKYLGNDGKYITFEVTVQSEVPGNAFFAIVDKSEGELYSSNVTPGIRVKTVKIEKRDSQVLNFKLVIGKKTYAKSFSVNTQKIETTTVAENDITML
ncbi:MAG: hypothetical protein JWQ09_1315 [Segetibacter sp.]|nr:hypothetical protein [Segetibacter sp.]